ncbi:hypothetical protein FA15DRAFT_391907 [Coprinopsis marcescibilis]|uniref:Uncharacterized protein n=1 Tax=Coprinopsis marcescibilis TaxID=230819 RepID=A0A5C3K9R3_COPMA|nr:hypothetical protein FA15DRAFT_391907 [Coprinopsis marcescibilis]
MQTTCLSRNLNANATAGMGFVPQSKMATLGAAHSTTTSHVPRPTHTPTARITPSTPNSTSKTADTPTRRSATPAVPEPIAAIKSRIASLLCWIRCWLSRRTRKMSESTCNLVKISIQYNGRQEPPNVRHQSIAQRRALRTGIENEPRGIITGSGVSHPSQNSAVLWIPVCPDALLLLPILVVTYYSNDMACCTKPWIIRS